MDRVESIVGRGAHALKLMNAILESDEQGAICMLCRDTFKPAHEKDLLCADCDSFINQHVAATAATQQLLAPARG